MKKIFLSIIAVASLVACTNDEVISYDKQAIAFTNAFVDNATRATDNFTITNDGTTALTEFTVYGTTQDINVNGQQGVNGNIVPIFNAVSVNKTANGWGYNCAEQYWIPGNNYCFAAVKNGTVSDSDLVNGLPSKITCDVTEQKDILYAEKFNIVGQTPSTTGVAANAPVAFTFDHLLSKAHFSVNNELAVENSTYGYRITSIVLNDVKKNGEYTPANKTWTATDSYDLEFGDMFGDNGEEVIKYDVTNITSEFARLMIPAEYAALSVTCTIETLLGNAVIDTNTYNASIPYTLVAGHAYNFVLTVKQPGEPIVFTVNPINGWIENHNGYNQGIGI